MSMGMAMQIDAIATTRTNLTFIFRSYGSYWQKVFDIVVFLRSSTGLLKLD